MQLILGNCSDYCLIDAKFEYLSRHSWCKNKDGYAVARVCGEVVYLHKMILRNTKLVDHINGNKLDNRTENLRLSNKSLNAINAPKLKGKFTSKYKGVSFSKRHNKWKASIMKDQVSYYLGLFKNEEDAALKYNEFAKEFFGEHAYLNVIDSQ